VHRDDALRFLFEPWRSYFNAPESEAPLFISRINPVLAFFLGTVSSFANITTSQTVEIDVNAAAMPFPHFWEKMFGSGRANFVAAR